MTGLFSGVLIGPDNIGITEDDSVFLKGPFWVSPSLPLRIGLGLTSFPLTSVVALAEGLMVKPGV